MKKEIRKEKIRRRKNFFPTLIIIFLSWVILGGIIYFIDPGTLGAIPLFLVVIFIALLFTFSTLLVNTRRGVIISLSTTLFLLLRYFGIGNIINFLLIAGLAITTELYFSKNS
jgi:hypothetical protein